VATFELTLPGIDGSNPLGFLAAFGTLLALDQSQAKLRWQWDGAWHPVLTSDIPTVSALARALDRDRQMCIGDSALALEYSGKRDLKPPPELFRAYLESLVAEAGLGSRRSVDWAAAFATDIAVDNNGNTKPTALHFAAGQQQFLQMVRDLAVGATSDDLLEAIQGPWRYSRPLPVMGWDSTASRDYALRANDPSTDKKLGVPGADWLAIRGLASLPTAPVGNRIVTTGCTGGWKSGRFQWPIWTVGIGVEVLRSLFAQDFADIAAPERLARGIGAVFSAGIKRSDQGGYGSFEPAVVA